MTLHFKWLSDTVAAAGQIWPADLPVIAAHGFKTVINNRPDGEGGPSQPASAQLQHAADLSRLRTGDVMTRDPLVLTEQESIGGAIDRLRARGVRRAPVISTSGMLVGLVSIDDLLVQVSQQLQNLALLVSYQQSRESR